MSLQQGSDVFDTQKDIFIKLVPDKERKQLSIIDSGIGMTESRFNQQSMLK